VGQAVETGEWGLARQITQSARGRIPDAPQKPAQRVVYEYVRRAIERECDRDTVADVMGIHSRTTWYKKRRGAYDFPLDAIDGRGGAPFSTETVDAEDNVEEAVESEVWSTECDDSGQLQATTVADVRESADSAAGTTDREGVTTDDRAGASENSHGDDPEMSAVLDETITNLRRLDHNQLPSEWFRPA